MVRRLEMAARANPDHPFLRAQREEIARFTGGAVLSRPIRSARSRGHAADRARHIRALEDLLELLDGSAADRLVTAVELASGVAAVSRALTELEFLASHQATVETDALRRMTRAIGKTTLPLLGAQQGLPDPGRNAGPCGRCARPGPEPSAAARTSSFQVKARP